MIIITAGNISAVWFGLLIVGLLMSLFLFLNSFVHDYSLDMGAYRCTECQGEMLNMKQASFAFSSHPITTDEILQQGIPCGLDCPGCESEMVSTPLNYIVPRKSNQSGHAYRGARALSGTPLDAIIVGLVIVDLISHEASQTREKRTRTIEIDGDRKSTRLNSSHALISYAVFCLKKKNKKKNTKKNNKQKQTQT